ncbi:Hypothetical protein CINCED_3A021193 [Cinara cedri]|uniref:Uncharacterized protein n=1 Tax=Cinara cedri TaxID=506608 RepID=A0A5E4MSL9_9HEMI|nr:Hypothetical protein CINCED_3A021193 [Cinara cedri]
MSSDGSVSEMSATEVISAGPFTMSRVRNWLSENARDSHTRGAIAALAQYRVSNDNAVLARHVFAVCHRRGRTDSGDPDADELAGATERGRLHAPADRFHGPFSDRAPLVQRPR